LPGTAGTSLGLDHRNDRTIAAFDRDQGTGVENDRHRLEGAVKVRARRALRRPASYDDGACACVACGGRDLGIADLALVVLEGSQEGVRRRKSPIAVDLRAEDLLDLADRLRHRPSVPTHGDGTRLVGCAGSDAVAIGGRTEREGFEPSNEVSPVTRFPVAPVQPLRHLSL
jgi:hypothetical protein